MVPRCLHHAHSSWNTGKQNNAAVAKCNGAYSWIKPFPYIVLFFLQLLHKMYNGIPLKYKTPLQIYNMFKTWHTHFISHHKWCVAISLLFKLGPELSIFHKCSQSFYTHNEQCRWEVHNNDYNGYLTCSPALRLCEIWIELDTSPFGNYKLTACALVPFTFQQHPILM